MTNLVGRCEIEDHKLAMLLLPAMTAEIKQLRALNNDKFNTIQAYCKAASEDKAKIKRLLTILEAALRQSGCDGDLCAYQWHEDARTAIAEMEAIA